MRACRVDRNHEEIVDALRARGALVLSLAKVGDGCPDLLVCTPIGDKQAYMLTLMEVKDGAKPPSGRYLTPKQIAFHREWPVTIVLSKEDALLAVGL